MKALAKITYFITYTISLAFSNSKKKLQSTSKSRIIQSEKAKLALGSTQI